MKAILAILGIVLAVIGCLVVPTFTHGIATAGAIIGILCLWLLGFKNIKIAHLGQPTLFGVRLRWYFGEGWCWRFPLIMGVEEIDARTGKKTFKTPNVFSKDNVRVSFTVAYWFQTGEPYLFLGTKGKEIFEGIEDVIGRRARLFIKDHKGEECRRADEEVGSQLKEEVDKVCGDWGITVSKLIVNDVNYPPDYEEALEAEQKRKYQVGGDAKEMESLTRRVKKISDKLGVSSEKAVEVDQLQTGKVKKTVQKIDVGENLKEMFTGPLEKGLEKGLEKMGDKIGEVAAKMVAGKTKKSGGKK